MLRSYHNFVNQSAEQRRAMHEKQEWIEELHRFDFDRIHSVTNLPIGGTIISSNKNYLATLREDGNFVIYVSSHFVDSNIVWQTHTAGKGHAPYRLTTQQDGDICLYDSNNHVLWSSGSKGKGMHPYTLLLTNEGNLEWYGAKGKLQWESNSTRK